MFHHAIAATTAKVTGLLRERTGINEVVLGGGVFHNRLLLGLLVQKLYDFKFTVHVPENVPFNDGSIALGQISIAKTMI